MITITVKGDAGTVERCKRKCAIGEIDFIVGTGPDIPKDFFCLCAWCHNTCITIPKDVRGLKAVV